MIHQMYMMWFSSMFNECLVISGMFIGIAIYIFGLFCLLAVNQPMFWEVRDSTIDDIVGFMKKVLLLFFSANLVVGLIIVIVEKCL